MEQRTINPWKWQDQYGFSQGIETVSASRVLYCAGQASVDDNAFLAAGDVVGRCLAGSAPPGTLLGISKLAFPGLMIEMEATAAK